jgi:hypothetical protein
MRMSLSTRTTEALQVGLALLIPAPKLVEILSEPLRRIEPGL